MGGIGSGRPLGSLDSKLRFPQVFFRSGMAMANIAGMPSVQSLRRLSVAAKVKTYPTGRKCQICGVTLSIYNPNNICTCHTKLHITY